MGKPVRMADIAEKLNISVVSVSKALAGKPGVSEEMRAKVVALAHQMGYEGVRPYAESGRTGNIGVLVADQLFGESTFYNNLYRYVVLSSGDEGFTSMLEIVTVEVEQTTQLPALVTGRKVDGLILIGNMKPTYLQAVVNSGLPCVLLDFHIPDARLDCVVSDNMEGGCALTEHLLEQGYREIGFIGRKGLKKAEMNKQKTGHFKVSFLSRRRQGEIRIKKELIVDIRIFWVNFFFSSLRPEGS